MLRNRRYFFLVTSASRCPMKVASSSSFSLSPRHLGKDSQENRLFISVSFSMCTLLLLSLSAHSDGNFPSIILLDSLFNFTDKVL